MTTLDQKISWVFLYLLMKPF